MKKDRNQYFKLQQKYDRLQSEFNVLKKTHMGVIEDCIDSKHKLREQLKKQKQKSNHDYNEMLHEMENKGWNEL